MGSNISKNFHILYQLELSAVCCGYSIICCHVHQVKHSVTGIVVNIAFLYDLFMTKAHRFYIEYDCFAWCKGIISLFVYTIARSRERFDKSAKGGVKLCLIP